MYNRSQRRRLAKQFGLFKIQDKLTKEDIANGITKIQKASERRERARIAGEQIHFSHLQKVYENLAKFEEETEVKMINSRKEWYIKNGLSIEEAEKRSKIEVQNQLEEQRRKESIRQDEKMMKKEWKKEGFSKRQIRKKMRSFRSSSKA